LHSITLELVTISSCDRYIASVSRKSLLVNVKSFVLVVVGGVVEAGWKKSPPVRVTLYVEIVNSGVCIERRNFGMTRTSPIES
jgi:hypothetical protein